MKSFGKFCPAIMLIAVTFFGASSLRAEVTQSGFQTNKAVTVKCENLEIQVPEGYNEKQLTVAIEKKPNLAQFKTPSGFVLISDLYKFGPTKLKLPSDKNILVKFKISSKMIPTGYKFQDLSIFYLNRKTKQIEEVYGQQWDSNKMMVSASLSYFKYDFVIGTNVRIAQSVIVKKVAPASGGGKHCEGGICPL